MNRIAQLRFVLLPGLDGTGLLFENFVRAAPVGLRLEVIPLPAELTDYDDLTEIIGRTVRLSSDTVIVAESFSGPLAIELAARYEVAKLVVCNSFACSPYPSLLKNLIWAPLFRPRLSHRLVRKYLLGRSASDPLVERVREVVASVPSTVLAGRLRAVLGVDVRRALARCKAPIQYLRGTDDRLIHERSVNELVSSAKTVIDVARIAGPHLLLQAVPELVWRAIDGYS